MSLFKARDWWSTTAGTEEEFDLGCLCVANIDNSSSGIDKIVVGSYHGFLRIYHPCPLKQEDGNWSGFRAEDVLLEQQLSAPILQVEAGKFVSGTENIHLAILHPRKLCVYGISGIGGAVEHGHQYQLNLIYEHNLQRTAYNFCYGSFGGVKGKDFICVQSMDCTLSIFEHETFAFSRFLPGSLLPGPIKYISRTDSFVTVSSSRLVECYKYQVLAVASDTREDSNMKSGKRVAMDWSFNVGEQALSIEVPNTSSPCIYVLGDRNLYCLTDIGKLKFMKKLEYNPSCLCIYGTKQEKVLYMIGTHTNTIMIFEDIYLKWAAQIQHIPVQMKVATFADLKGVIVTLDECGHIECSYLGTDPSMFTPPPCDAREINYSNQDEEMKTLQKAIKEAANKPGFRPNVKSEDEISINISIPSRLDDISKASEVLIIDDQEQIPSITIKVTIKAKSHVSNVNVAVQVARPLAASQTKQTFYSLSPNSPCETNISIFLRQPYLPSDMVMQVTATYQNVSGAPRVCHAKVRLPLKLVVHPSLPIKAADYKLTIDTNKPPVNLNDLFPDLVEEDSGGNAIGLQFYGDSVVTILASKTSQRYRLQSDKFEALWLPTYEIVSRLDMYHRTRGQADFKATFSGNIPLHEFFEVIDSHFQYRNNDLQIKDQLSQRAGQFRAIQRRLLTRFKDKTPAPLVNLDTLLDGTYKQLLHIADLAEDNKKNLEQISSALSCTVRLINFLISLWRPLTDKEFYILESSLTPLVSDMNEQGWEETVDGAVTHLLRTCLAKTSKDQTVNPAPLTMPKSTEKLKKHIALLFDKLGKGQKLNIDKLPHDLDVKQPGPAPILEKIKPRPKPHAENVTTESIPEEPSILPKQSVLGDLPPLTATGPMLESSIIPSMNEAPPDIPGGNKLSEGFLELKKQQDLRHKIPDLDDLAPNNRQRLNGTNNGEYSV
ncbi:protein PTHB1-like [Tubulanus polymorphus]|uniref:protein PTHB1-like n=1 Tax=Tubulanus polymorphus TaxID=672921 RepID=UPI003DA3A56A